MKAKPKSIVLFDDQYFVRESMKLLFEDRADLKLTGIFEDANNVLEDVKSSKPDLVLMDIDMPDTSGIKAVKILIKHFPKLPIIMLTQHEDEEKIINSICAGANGYLLKTTAGDKIIQSIHDVLNGGAALSPAITKTVLGLIADKFYLRTNAAPHTLTKREKEVLAHLVKGKSHKMIATDLGITYDTVRMHIKNLFRKLNVSSVAGLVSAAINNGLV
jgi:DNA-binding NarL/FixJ family response regulator